MEMEFTLHWMPPTQPVRLIHRQMITDCDTCTSLKSWLVSTQLEERAFLRLLQRARAIQQTHMIAWWIRFLTRESLLCSTTGNAIPSTWLLFSDDTIISETLFLKIQSIGVSALFYFSNCILLQPFNLQAVIFNPCFLIDITNFRFSRLWGC